MRGYIPSSIRRYRGDSRFCVAITSMPLESDWYILTDSVPNFTLSVAVGLPILNGFCAAQLYSSSVLSPSESIAACVDIFVIFHCVSTVKRAPHSVGSLYVL